MANVRVDHWVPAFTIHYSQFTVPGGPAWSRRASAAAAITCGGFGARKTEMKNGSNWFKMVLRTDGRQECSPQQKEADRNVRPPNPRQTGMSALLNLLP